jgi:hypothetical protein
MPWHFRPPLPRVRGSVDRTPPALDLGKLLARMTHPTTRRGTTRLSAGVVLLALTLASLPCRPAAAYDAIDVYDKRQVQGFTVYVNPQVLKQKQPAADALRELDGQLARVRSVVPRRALAALLKIPVWLEWETKPDGAAEFHPSAGWLKEHGYNPAKAGGVELSNAKNFVKWSRAEQPWMVLHEMSHGYHFLVLGEGHKGVKEAYRGAMDRKLYDLVEYAGRLKKRAYAATDEKEYFAEASEAFFGRNDFYPYVRTDLEKHDPAGFQLMREAWGIDVDEAERLLDKAEAAAKGGNAAGALAFLGKLTPAGRADKEVAERLAALQAKLEPAAEKLLADVEPMAKGGRRAAAVTRLKELSASMAGSAVGDRAKARLDELSAKP